MNADHFKGKWNQFKSELKKKWGEFTDDDLMKIEGDYAKFIGAVQKRCADRKNELGRWADEFRIAACALALVVSGIPMLFPQHAAAADNELLQQMDIGLFSVGGRAAYYDPQEGQIGKPQGSPIG